MPIPIADCHFHRRRTQGPAKSRAERSNLRSRHSLFQQAIQERTQNLFLTQIAYKSSRVRAPKTRDSSGVKITRIVNIALGA